MSSEDEPKYPKGKHPNSLANLKPAEIGNKRSVGYGRPCGKGDYPSTFRRCMRMLEKSGDVKFEKGEEEAPLVMQQVAIAFSKKSSQEVKQRAVENILNRLFGKAAQKLELEHHEAVPMSVKISTVDCSGEDEGTDEEK